MAIETTENQEYNEFTSKTNLEVRRNLIGFIHENFLNCKYSKSETEFNGDSQTIKFSTPYRGKHNYIKFVIPHDICVTYKEFIFSYQIDGVVKEYINLNIDEFHRIMHLFLEQN